MRQPKDYEENHFRHRIAVAMILLSVIAFCIWSLIEISRILP